MIHPPVEEADRTTEVVTVDNDEFGISIKMIDFNNRIVNNRDSVQTSYLGTKPWDAAHAYETETGLISTNLINGYPTITAHTEKEGSSLSGLFNNMNPVSGSTSPVIHAVLGRIDPELIVRGMSMTISPVVTADLVHETQASCRDTG